MDSDAFAWLRQDAQVIDRDHPDWDYYDEAQRIEDWIAEGASPVQPPMPEAPAVVELPAVALAVSRDQAAALLSISVDTFERRVLPDLRVAQVGRRQLVPVRELESWLSGKSARALRDR